MCDFNLLLELCVQNCPIFPNLCIFQLEDFCHLIQSQSFVGFHLWIIKIMCATLILWVIISGIDLRVGYDFFLKGSNC